MERGRAKDKDGKVALCWENCWEVCWQAGCVGEVRSKAFQRTKGDRDRCSGSGDMGPTREGVPGEITQSVCRAEQVDCRLPGN